MNSSSRLRRGLRPGKSRGSPANNAPPRTSRPARSYTGGNSLYLMSRGIRQGHGDNRWGTYRQIAAAGGQVRKGQKGTQVLFFTDRTRKTEKDEQGKPVKDRDGKQVYQEEQRSCPVVRQYTVFNVEQADGLELKPRAARPTPEWQTHQEAERVIGASGTTVRARRRRSGLLSARRGQGCASGTRSVPHPKRLLPDGVA